MHYNIVVFDETGIVNAEIISMLKNLNMDITGIRDENELIDLLYAKHDNISAIVWAAGSKTHEHLDLIKRIKALQECRNIPIAVISENNSKECITKAAEYGVAEYIMSPYNDATVVAKIGNMLKLPDSSGIGLSQCEDIAMFCFSDMLNKELKSASRGGYPMSILITAVVPVNENADERSNSSEIMDLLSTVYKSKLRDTDTVFQAGENRHIMLLPFADLNGAEVVKQKIYETFNSHFVIKQKCSGFKLVLASVTYPDNGKTANRLLEMLEACLQLSIAKDII